jgi:hypothetical protein
MDVEQFRSLLPCSSTIPILEYFWNTSGYGYSIEGIDSSRIAIPE